MLLALKIILRTVVGLSLLPALAALAPVVLLCWVSYWMTPPATHRSTLPAE